MTPALTVIVPGFDVGPWVGEALASLRSQTFREWRAVLVDDASTDDTLEIFTRAAAQDERFSVIRHAERRAWPPPATPGSTRWTPPTWPSSTATIGSPPPPSSASSPSSTTPAATSSSAPTCGSDPMRRGLRRRTGSAVGHRRNPPRASAHLLEEHPAASGNIVAWSKVSRHDFWQRAGLRFPEGRLYEDQILAQRMYAAARAFDVIPDVVVEWRERADGSSITQHREVLPVLRDYLDGLRGGLEILDAAGHPAAVRARIEPHPHPGSPTPRHHRALA